MDPFERVKRAVRDAITHSGRNAATPGRTAEAAFEGGDFAEAERLFGETAVQLKGRNPERKRYAKALLMMAAAQWKQEKYAEAKANAGLARPVLADANQPADLADCLNLLGSVALEQGEAGQAVSLLEEAVETAGRIRPPNPLTVSNLLRRLSEALRRGGNPEKAKPAASRALNLVQDRYGKDDVNTGECLLELGQCEREGGDPAGAIQTLRRALDIFQQDRGRDSDQEIRTLQFLAEACQAAGDLEQAVGFYERALKARERQLGGEAEDVTSLLTSLGAVLSLMGRHGPAIETLQQAVVRLEGARDPRLGSALDLLGNVYFQFGRFEDAVTCVRRARSVLEAAPAANKRALDANQAMLADIAAYLPAQRRVALGLVAEDPSPEPAAAPARKKAAPWNEPEKAAAKEERPAPPPKPPRPARRPAPTPVAVTEAPPSETSAMLPPGTTLVPAGMFGAESGAAGVQFPQGTVYAVPPGYVPVLDPGAAFPYGVPGGGPVYGAPGIPAAGGPPGVSLLLRHLDGTLAELGAQQLVSDANTMPSMGGGGAGMPFPAYAGELDGSPIYAVPGGQTGSGAGMSVALLRSDGTVVDPPTQNGLPLHLNIVLGEGGYPAGHVLTAQVPEPHAEPPVPPGLTGWDELGFELLPWVEGAARSGWDSR